MERIQVYADAETKRRIELAAAKRNLPVTVYCLDAIMQQISEDEILDQERIEIAVRPQPQIIDAHLVAQMSSLGERIKARRGNKPIPTDIVDRVRAERDEELDAGATTGKGARREA
jgi:uncharacterized protein (DUF1778 family)